MPAREVSYRLKVDGQAESLRAWSQEKEAGVGAGRAIGAAFEDSAAKADATVQRQIAAWRRLAQTAIEEDRRMANNAKFSAVLGVGGGSGKSARDSASVFEQQLAGGLSRNQMASRLNLSRQGADVLVTAAMGMNPAMIAIQQGPQILDAWSSSGLKLKTSMLAAWGAVGAGVAAVAALALAADRYADAQRGLEGTTQGLGAASGVTAAKAEMLATASARAADISVTAAREIGIEYLETGRIGDQVLGDLITLTKDFAATTRQDVAGATKELAAAFAEPAKGAAALNAKLDFLLPGELKHIENLVKAGQAADAQAILLEKLKGRLVDANTTTGFWTQGFQNLKTGIDDAFNSLGRLIGLMNGTQNATAALAEKRKQLILASFDPLGLKGGLRDSLKAEIAGLERSLTAGSDAPAVQAANDAAARAEEKRKEAERLARKGAAAERAAEREAERVQDYADKAAISFQTMAVDRMVGLRKIDLDLERKLAVTRGDSLDYLDRMADYEARIVEFQKLGVSWQEAHTLAYQDTLALLNAELEMRRKLPEGFVSAANQNAKLEAAFGDGSQGRIQAKIDSLRQPLGDAIAEGFYAVNDNDKFFNGFRDRMKLSLLQAVSDRSITGVLDGLFGNREKGTDGLVGAALTYFGFGKIGHNAKGTDNWRGGLTWVNEGGPELIDLPAGAKVFSHERSMQMLASQGGNVIYMGGISVSGGASEDMVRRAVREGMTEAISISEQRAGPAAENYLKRTWQIGQN